MARGQVTDPRSYVPDYSWIGQGAGILSGMIKETPHMVAFDKQIRQNDNFNNEAYDALDKVYRSALNDAGPDGARYKLAEKLGLDPESPELDEMVMSKLRRPGEREDKNEYLAELVNNSVGLFQGMGESLPYLAQLTTMGGDEKSQAGAKEAYETQRTKESRKMLFANADKGTYGKSSEFWADAEKNGIDPESLSKDPRSGGILSGIKAKGVTNAQNSVMEVFRLRYDPKDEEGKTPDSFEEMLNVALTKGYAALDDPNDPIQRQAVQEMVAAQKGIELAQNKSNGDLAKLGMEERKLLVGHLEDTLKRDSSRLRELEKLRAEEFISPEDLEDANNQITYLKNTIKKNQTLKDTVLRTQTQAYEPEAEFEDKPKGPLALVPDQGPSTAPAPVPKDTKKIVKEIESGQAVTPDQSYALSVEKDMALVEEMKAKKFPKGWVKGGKTPAEYQREELLAADKNNKLTPQANGTFLWTKTYDGQDFVVGVYDKDMNFTPKATGTTEPEKDVKTFSKGGGSAPAPTGNATLDLNEYVTQ